MMYIEIRLVISHPQGTCPTDDGMNVIPLPEMAAGRERLSWGSVAPSPHFKVDFFLLARPIEAPPFRFQH